MIAKDCSFAKDTLYILAVEIPPLLLIDPDQEGEAIFLEYISKSLPFKIRSSVSNRKFLVTTFRLLKLGSFTFIDTQVHPLFKGIFCSTKVVLAKITGLLSVPNIPLSSKSMVRLPSKVASIIFPCEASQILNLIFSPEISLL